MKQAHLYNLQLVTHHETEDKGFEWNYQVLAISAEAALTFIEPIQDSNGYYVQSVKLELTHRNYTEVKQSFVCRMMK